MKIKRRYWIIITLLMVLFLGIILFLRAPSHKKPAQPTSKQLTIETPGDYQIEYAHTVSLPKKDGSISNATIVATNGSFSESPRLDVYEDTDSSYTKIYSFIPDMPETKGFLIQIYDVTPILSGNDSAGDLDGIFLSISQTGADYWGSYPVLIKYDKDQGFSLADFDSGNSSADSQIKPYMGPPSGIVEIANQLNENNKARSIMAEGADFNYPNIEVTFYTDNNPHSFQHTTVTLKFPVSGLPPSY